MKISIKFNDSNIEVDAGTTIADIVSKLYPSGDVIIYNTVINPDLNTVLNDGDCLVVFQKGIMPSVEDVSVFFHARQKTEVTNQLRKAKVGVAGLGGLGSVVVENLVRAGVGQLVIADFDVVDPSNLNRQRYFADQVGKYKTDAVFENINRISNLTKVKIFNEKVTENNCKEIFSGCSVIAECFDSASAKAELVRALRKHLPDSFVVAVSGIAGIGSEKEITITRISDKLFVVGDMKSEVQEGYGLVATRVGIAASIESHLILRLLVGEEK